MLLHAEEMSQSCAKEPQAAARERTNHTTHCERRRMRAASTQHRHTTCGCGLGAPALALEQGCTGGNTRHRHVGGEGAPLYRCLSQGAWEVCSLCF